MKTTSWMKLCKGAVLALAEVELSKIIEKTAIEISNGKIIINKRDEDIYFKEENRLYKLI